MPFLFCLNYRNRFKGLLLSFVYILEFLQIRRLSNLVGLLIPVTAAAAAINGLANNVLEPGPWRPSKFLLEYLPHIFRQELIIIHR
jgi:hypothetical protein